MKNLIKKLELYYKSNFQNMKSAISILVMGIILLGCKMKPETLFEKIPGAETNIDFRNEMKPTEELNAFTFTNFYNGGGVGIGDFNNDGLKDVFFTGNQVSSELYLNKGNMKFEKITEKAGLKTDRWCNGVSIVDINSDGWDDIYIAVPVHNTMVKTQNLLYINQKTPVPTFKEQAKEYGLDYAGYTTQSVFFDYDIDGDLDVFLLNTSPDTQNPSYNRVSINDGTHPSASKLFQNTGIENGHPVFTDVSLKAGITYEGLGLGVVVSDYNDDNLPDIYCSNDFLSSDVLYINNGDGTFKNVVKDAMPHTAMSGMGMDAADINQDGKVDIFQLDMMPEDNARQKQMLGRQDYDRKEISINPPYNFQLQYMRNMLQINLGTKNGVPQFSENGLLAGIAKTDWSWSALLCDLDNDRQKDIFISNGYRKNVTDLDFISYFRNNEMFGSEKARSQSRKNLVEKVPEIPLKDYAFKNKGNLDFENVSELWGLDEMSFSNGTAYADLDNDGDLDLIVNNIDNEASVFKNKTIEKTKNRSLKLDFEGSEFNKSGIGAKVTAWVAGEKLHFQNFPVRGYLSTMQKGLLIGLGHGSLVDSMQVVWPDGKSQILKNLDSNVAQLTLKYSNSLKLNEKTDVVSPYFSPDDNLIEYVHKESDFLDFNENAALHKMLSRFGPAVVQGDINGDGLEDFVAGGAFRGSETMVFVQDKNGGFQKRQEIATAMVMEIGALKLFDADGDRDQDLVIAAGSCEQPLETQGAFQPRLWLNDGKGNFTATGNLPKISVSSQVIEAIDFDRDGDLDLFVGGRITPIQYPKQADSYILKNDNGKFTDVTSQTAPFLKGLGMVCDAAVGDFDKDGWVDIALVGEWMPITILKNKKGTFEENIKDDTEGWWNCIEVADVNKDGFPDLIMGNEGLNSFYRASTDQPIVMLAKDFDNDKKMDAVMGHYLQNKLVPVHPRENLNLQINSFRKKFITFKDYSLARFDDLFSEEEKEGSVKKQAKMLQTSIAINDRKGDFAIKLLPWQAQQSPVFSIITDDFNRDGKIDILLSGRFYPNEAHQGRQDASRGVLLAGNDKGDFSAIDFEKSGLNFQGDTRKSLYFKSSGTLLTFCNSGKAEGYRLKGN